MFVQLWGSNTQSYVTVMFIQLWGSNTQSYNVHSALRVKHTVFLSQSHLSSSEGQPHSLLVAITFIHLRRSNTQSSCQSRSSSSEGQIHRLHVSHVHPALRVKRSSSRVIQPLRQVRVRHTVIVSLISQTILAVSGLKLWAAFLWHAHSFHKFQFQLLASYSKCIKLNCNTLNSVY